MLPKHNLLIYIGMSILLTAEICYARDDWQQFQDINFKYKLNKNLSLSVKPEARFKHDFGHLYYYAFAQGVIYSLNDSIDMEAMYQYSEQENPKKHKFDKENRLYGGPILKCKIGGFDLSDRNRMEYRYIGNKPKWRYRNEFKISHPAQTGGFKFSPFVADEIYYDLKEDEFNLNWLTLGITQKVNNHLSVDTYYRLQSQKSNKNWNEDNILGSSLKISF